MEPGHLKTQPHVRAVLKRIRQDVRRLTHRQRILFTLLLAMIPATLGAIWVSTLLSTPTSEPKKIIFIGRQAPYETTDPPEVRLVKDHDQFHFAALSYHLDKLEQELGQDLFELEYRSNNEKPDHSIANYVSLADDPSTVLVVDNTWGADFQPAAPSIISSGIPVISLNADRGIADFNDQVIFLGADDNTPMVLIDFLTEVLMENEVTFVTEDNYPLKLIFEDLFENRADISVRQTFTLAGDEPQSGALERKIAELSKYLEDETARKLPIILNVHGDWGSDLIRALDAKFPDLTLLAGGSAVNQKFEYRSFGAQFSSNRLFVNFSAAADAVSEKTYADIKELQPSFTEYTAVRNVPLFLSRIRDATMLIQFALEHRTENGPITRETFLNYMKHLTKSGNRCVVTPDDLLDFDEHLTRKKDIQFVLHQSGEANSYLEQLDRKGERIPNIRMGIQVVSIFDIDVRAGDFGADFFYWTEERRPASDALTAGAIEPTSPYYAEKDDIPEIDRAESAAARWLAETPVLFKNLKELNLSEEPVTILGDNEIYRLYRLSGRFYTQFNIKDYPLDRQHLRIEAEVLNPSDFLRLSFDKESLQETGVGNGATRVDEWGIEEFYMTVDNELGNALYGRSFPRECSQKFKHLTAHVVVKRRFADAFLTVVVPLLLIGLVAISLLFVRDTKFHEVGDAAIGVFLGIIAFLIALTDIAPDLSQISRGGALFWSTFGVVAGVILVIVAVNSNSISEERRTTVLRAGKLVIPALYLLSIVLIPML